MDRTHVLRVARERLHAHPLCFSSSQPPRRSVLAAVHEAETGGTVASHEIVAGNVDSPEGPHARQGGVLRVKYRYDGYHALATTKDLVEGVERVDAQNVNRIVHQDALQCVDCVVDAIATEGR